MPSICDVINEKYGVGGENIADALCQAAGQKGATHNIADAAALLAEAKKQETQTAEPDDPNGL